MIMKSGLEVAADLGETLYTIGKVVIGGAGLITVLGLGAIGYCKCKDYIYEHHESEAYVGLQFAALSAPLYEKMPSDLNSLEGKGYMVNWFAHDPDGIARVVLYRNGILVTSQPAVQRNDDGTYPTTQGDVIYHTAKASEEFSIVAYDTKGNEITGNVAHLHLVK
jgi:hypothetical protein